VHSIQKCLFGNATYGVMMYWLKRLFDIRRLRFDSLV